MPQRLRHVRAFCLCMTFSLSTAWPAHKIAATEEAPVSGTGILPLDDVRIGMKGYGLTVFQGTRIEPFRVEVVAVMRNFAPGRAVIWVRCTDQRMQKLGPVQGMSGSPIYLWPESDPSEQPLGKGGKLIGALALGFTGTKDCYVGIQPIEHMRQVAGRIAHNDDRDEPCGQITTDGTRTLSQIAALLTNAAPAPSWRARAVLRIATAVNGPLGNASTARPPDTAFLQPPNLHGQVQPMTMPMMVGSPDVARAIAPALAPLGITPVPLSAFAAGPGRPEAAMADDQVVVGTPPPGVDLESIRLEPGSVLSVPLAFGDLDLTALGTVTELQADGRVLGFGHGIFGQGPMAVPMATGYVHFIMPSLTSSFKLGGSGAIRGAIVRDEHSAVIGIHAGRFSTAPVEVVVNGPGGERTSEYHYRIVHHRKLTPFIATAVVLQSITADSNLPVENTLRLRGSAQFSGDRSLHLDSTMVDASPTDMLLELLPVIATMMQNPHESMRLESLRLTADIDPAIRAGSIVNASIDKAQLAPGDVVRVTVGIQPYGRQPIKQHITLTLPESLADGEYDLILCDAQTYVRRLLDSRPHLLVTANADDLRTVLQRILGVANDALYVVLQLPESGLAMGRQELPRLPSSRRALFDTTTSTVATPYVEWVEKVTPMGLVIQGNTTFSIVVRKSPGK